MVSGRSSGHRHRRQPTIAVTSLYLIPFVSLLLLLLLVPTPTAAFTGRTPLRRRFLQRSSSTVPTTLMEAGRSSSGDGQQPPLPPGAVVLTVGEIEGSLEPPPAPAAVGCGGELEEDPVAAAKRTWGMCMLAMTMCVLLEGDRTTRAIKRMVPSSSSSS